MATEATDGRTDACLKRQQPALSAYSSGCGLIVKACYDEVEVQYRKRIDDALARLSRGGCLANIEVLSQKLDELRNAIDGAAGPGSSQQLDIRLISIRPQLGLVEAIEQRCRKR